MEPIVITVVGPVPSKKNSYTPNKNGKGFHKSHDLQDSINRLAIQIPGDIRDLKLENCDMDFNFTFRSFNADRDNKVTTLLDILVQYGVLKDDNTERCNGRITVHPAVRGEYDSVTIVLLPKEKPDQPATRYAPLRRKKRTTPLLDLHPPEVGLDRFAELPEDTFSE